MSRCDFALSAEIIVKALSTIEVIESYPDDKYLPSFLVRGESAGTVFHAQIATDVEGDNVRVVTMYVPTADEWTQGLRMRRAKT